MCKATNSGSIVQRLTIDTKKLCASVRKAKCDWTLKIFWNIIPGHKDIKVLELQFVYKITHYNEKSYLFSFDIDSRISGERDFRRKYYICYRFLGWTSTFFLRSARFGWAANQVFREKELNQLFGQWKVSRSLKSCDSWSCAIKEEIMNSLLMASWFYGLLIKAGFVCWWCQ